MTVWSRLRTAWRLCWATGRGLTLVQVVITLIGGFLASAVTWSTKFMMDGLAEHGPSRQLITAVAVLAAAGLLGACEPRIAEYVRAELNRRAYLLMNDRLFTAVGDFQGLERFEDPRLLDRIRSAQQSTSNAVAPATTGLFAAVRDLVSLTGLLATVYLLAPAMALVLMLSAAPVFFAQLSLSRRFAAMLDTMSASSRRQFQLSALNSDVRAVKEIRLFGLVDFFRERVLATIEATNHAQRDLDRRQLRVQAALAALGSAIAAGGLAWAVYAASRDRLSIGDVSAFVTAVAAAQAALSGLVTKISGAHRGLLQLDHYVRVVNMPSDRPVPALPAALPTLTSGIDLVDIWFRYDRSQPWVLRGLDARIAHGESLALVGRNGAGKSTLIKLLCRFYEPDRGAILWDGVDIRDVPITELRRRLGVLFQDFMEYDLTVAENIGIGDLPALSDRHKIARAATEAGVSEKIETLPHGYDTMLSRIFFKETDKNDAEHGVTVSGGQWQRIAIARTLMRDDRELLILDEPGSGLDAEAEHRIHRRLKTHRTGRTSVLVSHRLGAVRDADRILVLDGGRVAEEGTHASLMALNGQYAQMFTLQAQGYAIAGTG
ncbi:ABC transporter ATP-binding protein [Nocardia pseudobrasiliensis]|uniref:ATP-binding cassette subfamily B protein n=1 Tax=Nocardia pseudobrasiliensis TaxID=45979 RepID=A0A370IIE4_9NOCA|nr:ABC transporter ATP-binding protein [Nocardia pseudobrasiliensis]RDI69254.1 ATP-binding cassette subfamily B protein [Nocardia pseudobrasiliensis]